MSMPNAGPDARSLDPLAPPGVARFVGRARERAQLADALGVALDGHFRVVLVTGEPGVGKTRLVTATVAGLASGSVVLSARAYPMGSTASLGMWVEALDRHLRALDQGTIRQLCDGVADELAALLPSVALAFDAQLGTEPPRIRILASLSVLLERLAARSPLVVHLDDAHLADGTSWETLSYLANNLPTSRILVLVSARPGELSQHAAALEVLSALEQEGQLARLSLAPLPADDLADLATGVVGRELASHALVEWLMDRTRGNPLFALGLLGALIEEGADLAHPALRRLPESLTDRVEAGLAGLQPNDRAVLELLATVGYRAQFSELLGLAGLRADELARILERLGHRRLLHETDRERELSYEVAHPLIAEVVYAGIGGARRRSLHLGVARVLIASGRPGAAAAHFLLAAPVGDPEAVSALIAAFRQAETRELTREAMTILDGLLQLVPSGDPRWSDVFDVMRPLAPWIIDHRTDVGASIGTRAMLAIEQVIALQPDKVRLALVKFNLATFSAWGSGDLVAARRRIEEAHALLEEAGEHQMARLAANEIGYLSGLEGDLPAHERQARQILEAADSDGQTFVALQALCSLALALLWSGQLAASFQYMERALIIAREEQYLYRVTYVLALLGFASTLDGDAVASHLHLEEAMAANPAYRDTLLPDLRASCHWMTGELAEGASWAVELSGWLTSGAVSRRRSFGAVFAALCLLELGRVEQADHLLRKASEPFGTSRWWLYGQLLAWANAVASWRTTSSAASVAALTDAADSIVGVGGSMLAPLVVADLAEVAAHARDQPLACHVAELLNRMSMPESEPFVGLASFVRAAVALASGRSDESADEADRSAASFARSGWQLWQGRALALGGRATAERVAAFRASEASDDDVRGRDLLVDRANRMLGDASELFAAIGAATRHQEVEADRSALDRRGRKTARARDGDQVTSRELEVAMLAVEGLSARDIAQKLYISKRTVETHLASVYRKLGVSSRLELARSLARLNEGPRPISQ